MSYLENIFLNIHTFQTKLKQVHSYQWRSFKDFIDILWRLVIAVLSRRNKFKRF